MNGLAQILAARGYCVRGSDNTTSPFTERLAQLGFPVSPEYRVYEDIEEAIRRIEEIGRLRGTLRFDIDGAVLKVDKGSVMDLANLGLCEKFLGQREAAMEHLAAALEVDPSLDFARTHLEELKASL